MNHSNEKSKKALTTIKAFAEQKLYNINGTSVEEDCAREAYESVIEEIEEHIEAIQNEKQGSF